MTKTELERRFPKLREHGYQVTSPFDEDYNCISFAAEDSERRWWWPSDSPDCYWPSGVPRSETIDAVVLAFAGLGYELCPGGALEPGFQKVAIFANNRGVPTHAARQLSDGTWTSKLGKCEDIRHADVTGVEDDPAIRTAYGRVSVFMRRPMIRA